jgi:lipopolysaccharide export system permease protein
MRKISRYILNEFISILLYSILAFVAIYILVDTVENIDRFIDSSLSLKYIFLYYAFYLPYIIVLTLPVAMLLATMFSLGRLVGDNEITAMKASGISLYRIFIPLYIFALIIGIVVMFFAEMIVPKTNILRQDIKDLTRINAKDRDAYFSLSFSKNREMDRQNVFLSNGDGRIINAQVYRSKNKRAENVCIMEPLNNISKLSLSGTNTFDGFMSRVDADSLTYKDGMWILHHATEHIFEKDGEKLNYYHVLPAPFISLKPSDFARIDVKPEEMNFFELSNYIRQVKSKGGDASEWLVDLYLKISFPFVSLVIVFFGAPLAAGSSLRGKTASFGIALVICFIFYTLINAFQILGRNGALNPVVAAWLPNGIFLVVGFFMHIRARK